MEYKCIDCWQVFKTKQNLIKHQTKVFKCNHITKYKCDNCFKYFKTRGNLNKHNEDQVCSDKSNLILYKIGSLANYTCECYEYEVI